MKDAQDNPSSAIINVIDEFNYSTQADSYSSSFKKWRRKKDNPYSFSFEVNRNESVFIDGKGFVDNSQSDTEKETISHIFYDIGLASLIWLVIGTLGSKLLVYLLSVIGVDVHNNLFSSSLYGGKAEIVIVLIAAAAAKVLVPSLFLHFRFRLPAKVETMRTLHSPCGLLGAFSMTLIVCTVISLPAAYSNQSKEIYEFFRSVETDVSVWDQTEFMAYTIFDVLVLSVLNELFFRGAMFAVLRQFGDAYAIIMTTLTAACLTMSFREMPAVILVSLVASYGMLRSGSIFTAFFVSIVYKMYQLTLNIIELDTTEKMFLTRNAFILIMLLIGIVGLAVFWLITRKKGSGLVSYSSDQSFFRRVLIAVKTFPYSAVLAITLVYAFVRAAL